MTKKKEITTPGRKMIITIAIILFISAWMFILGIMIGRGTAPIDVVVENLQEKLNPEEPSVEGITAENDSSGISGDIKTELIFYEELNNNRNINRKKPVNPVNKPDNKFGDKPADKSVTTSTGDSHIDTPEKKVTIQVASLKKSEDADRMVSALQKKGFPAYKVLAKIPDKGIWIRVRVGHFKNRTQARDMLSRLKSIKECKNAILINK